MAISDQRLIFDAFWKSIFVNKQRSKSYENLVLEASWGVSGSSWKDFQDQVGEENGGKEAWKEKGGARKEKEIFAKLNEKSSNLLGIRISKMIPRPSKNGSNSCRKAFQIQARRHQNRGPEGSRASLEASWAVLGHLGRFWKRLGPS